MSACAPLEHEIECGKFSYTDFSSHAPKAHRLKCSRGAQAQTLCAASVSLYLKPGIYLGFFISKIGRWLLLPLIKLAKSV